MRFAVWLLSFCASTSHRMNRCEHWRTFEHSKSIAVCIVSFRSIPFSLNGKRSSSVLWVSSKLFVSHSCAFAYIISFDRPFTFRQQRKFSFRKKKFKLKKPLRYGQFRMYQRFSLSAIVSFKLITKLLIRYVFFYRVCVFVFGSYVWRAGVYGVCVVSVVFLSFTHWLTRLIRLWTSDERSSEINKKSRIKYSTQNEMLWLNGSGQMRAPYAYCLHTTHTHQRRLNRFAAHPFYGTICCRCFDAKFIINAIRARARFFSVNIFRATENGAINNFTHLRIVSGDEFEFDVTSAHVIHNCH